MPQLFPLWDAGNDTQFSSLFNVPPGFSCLLTADGLLAEAYRANATDVKEPQMACIRRVLFDFDRSNGCGYHSATSSTRLKCDWIYDTSTVRVGEMSNIPVVSCCEPWFLSKFDNVRAIGIPGTYCIMLNDPTAVGVAQVYAEQISNDAVLPGALDRLFFP